MTEARGKIGRTSGQLLEAIAVARSGDKVIYVHRGEAEYFVRLCRHLCAMQNVKVRGGWRDLDVGERDGTIGFSRLKDEESLGEVRTDIPVIVDHAITDRP